MTPTHNYRYPGAQPFTTSEEHIFFGRQADIVALHRQVRLEPLLVLYAKSGLGKSSLLNAGLVPAVEKEGKYLPVSIRFNAYNPAEEEQTSPLASTKQAIAQATQAQEASTYLEKLLPEEGSLWYQLKQAQARSNNQQQLLLLFDQFEELFTYPESDIQSFKEALAEVLYTQIPQRFRAIVEQEVEEPEHLAPEELAQLHQPFDAHIVMAIRSDRISLLDRLADHLPTIKRSWYELDALQLEQAEDAILNPAYMKGAFLSPIFDYDDQALQQMLNFLTQGNNQKIESFQLQILCQAIERKVMRQDLKMVTAADLGNIEEVYENYYSDQIQSISNPEDQLLARRFIEEGLIFADEERRLSLYEGQVFSQFGLSTELLRELEDTHLIRREPSMKGGYTYELSHDTLVAPVLHAKELRLAAERQAAEKAERLRQAEELRLAKEKVAAEQQLRATAQANEQRARQRTRLAVVISIIGLMLAGLAGWSYDQARKDRDKAETAEEKANDNAALAAEKAKEAADNLALAKEEERKTLKALEDLQTQQAATEQERKKAEQAAQRARTALNNLQQSNIKVVQLILDNARKDVLQLDYENALLKIKAADGLGALKDSVAYAYLEIAFWHNEVHHRDRAVGLLDSAAVLLGNNQIRSALKDVPFGTLVAKQAVRETLKALNPLAFQTYQERYYPVMIPVEGGTFMMGCDPKIDNNCESHETQHKATVSDFAMAKYETTWWQYQLFCTLTGYEYESPSWGRIGNNPAVNISWYDALAYANWLSEEQGLTKAITQDSPRKYRVEVRSSGYRLPTEVEWEYAAKGGQFKEPYVYSGSNIVDSVGWYSTNSDGHTQPVGQLKPNALGLYDMSGNVWEWCWDWYATYPSDENITDYTGASEGDYRVLRGGSWFLHDDNCRSSNRGSSFPNNWVNVIGFRLSRTR